MNLIQLIELKRDGGELSADKISQFISHLPELPDYQVSAFLMAVLFQGMTPQETKALTLAMRDSGEVLRFPNDPRPLVDKHSTGGVGDKVSLPLAPLLACLGFRVPMISGRGLGITGGTLDKLESIPGLRTSFAEEEIVKIVQEVGCVICAQTECMVPADKRLYALRDITGTVPSIPLITSSILSKKLAEGLDALVLDVKFGTAAFIQGKAQARELALAMVSLGRECGVNVRAMLTDMNSPLGRAAGNWLEVKESVACLDGNGPDDLLKLVVNCASHLMVQTGRADSLSSGTKQAEDCLATGAPRRKWDEMLAAQGADMKEFNLKLTRNEEAAFAVDVKSDRDGFVSICDARIVGEVVRDLGGGRFSKETCIDREVGVEALAKPGEQVELGSVLGRVHLAERTQADEAVARVRRAFHITTEPAPARPLICDVIS